MFAKNFCITIYLSKKLKELFVIIALKDFCTKIFVKKLYFNRDLITCFNKEFFVVIVNFLDIIRTNF